MVHSWQFYNILFAQFMKNTTFREILQHLLSSKIQAFIEKSNISSMALRPISLGAWPLGPVVAATSSLNWEHERTLKM